MTTTIAGNQPRRSLSALVALIALVATSLMLTGQPASARTGPSPESSTRLHAPGGPSTTRTPTHSPTYTPNTSNAFTSTSTGTPGKPDTPAPEPTCGPSTQYLTTTSTGAAIVPGDALVPGSQADDALVDIAFPFNYYIYGSPSAHAYAGTDGVLIFYTGGNSGSNTCLPILSWQRVIFPHWDSLDMSPNAASGLGIYTSVSGSAPNRIFSIEWRACLHSMLGCGGIVTFEVRLFEHQERFDIIYGSVAGGGAGATVGVQNYRGQGMTQFSCNAPTLYPGLQITFQEPSCSNPYPTFTPTYTPTPTPTPAPPVPGINPSIDSPPRDFCQAFLTT